MMVSVRPEQARGEFPIVELPKKFFLKSKTGVGGHPGVFSIFLDRAPGFFLRIFTGNFWIFLRTRCPPAEICSRFSLFGGVFFLAFFGFSELLPSLSRGHFEKMGKFLADTRFGHYHQRVA